MLLALSGGRIGLAGSIYCGWGVVQYSSHYGLVSLGAKNIIYQVGNISYTSFVKWVRFSAIFVALIRVTPN